MDSLLAQSEQFSDPRVLVPIDKLVGWLVVIEPLPLSCMMEQVRDNCSERLCSREFEIEEDSGEDN